MHQQFEAPPAPLIAAAIVAAKTGDVSALQFLYVRYADSVHRYVSSVVHNRKDAQQMHQTLFRDLPQVIALYEPGEVALDVWLLGGLKGSLAERRRAAGKAT